jgi:hypothetical protein
MNAQGPWHCKYLNKSNDPENWYYVRPPLELSPPPSSLANPKGREDPHALQGKAELGSMREPSQACPVHRDMETLQYHGRTQKETMPPRNEKCCLDNFCYKLGF